jgi:hypothetical protein
MAVQLGNVLLSLTDHAKALAQVQNLEQFQDESKDLCKSFSLSLEQLASARSHCSQTDGTAWQEYSEQGVVIADAVRFVSELLLCMVHKLSVIWALLWQHAGP